MTTGDLVWRVAKMLENAPIAERLAAYANQESAATRQADALKAARTHQGRGLIERLAQRSVINTMAEGEQHR